MTKHLKNSWLSRTPWILAAVLVFACSDDPSTPTAEAADSGGGSTSSTTDTPSNPTENPSSASAGETPAETTDISSSTSTSETTGETPGATTDATSGDTTSSGTTSTATSSSTGETPGATTDATSGDTTSSGMASTATSSSTGEGGSSNIMEACQSVCEQAIHVCQISLPLNSVEVCTNNCVASYAQDMGACLEAGIDWLDCIKGLECAELKDALYFGEHGGCADAAAAFHAACD